LATWKSACLMPQRQRLVSEARLRAEENWRGCYYRIVLNTDLGCHRKRRRGAEKYILLVIEDPVIVRILLERFLDTCHCAFDVGFGQRRHDYGHGHGHDGAMCCSSLCDADDAVFDGRAHGLAGHVRSGRTRSVTWSDMRCGLGQCPSVNSTLLPRDQASMVSIS